MKTHKLLIANRGEIAIRIAQAAFEQNIVSVAVYSKDDAQSLHTRKCDQALPLAGVGPSAYLDSAQIIAIAQQTNCTMIHAGYGFLSENGRFAQACLDAGLIFVGPTPQTLDLFGDKATARTFAQSANVPLIEGLNNPTIEEAEAFFTSLPNGSAIVVKAVAGGGGRGMRIVADVEALAEAWQVCQNEANLAFGNGALYVERYLPIARHVEIQIVGDGTGTVVPLGERECSLQRRHQKVVEIAPAPTMSAELRARLVETAVSLAKRASYKNLGTFEFLVEGNALTADANFYFIEANPRLQVEHTVTEEAFGLDLVQMQLHIANGRLLTDLNLDPHKPPQPSKMALQLRLNMETMTESGEVLPSVGQLRHFQLPSGVGVRVDTFGYAGYTPSPRFDSLLAKLICTVNEQAFEALRRKSARALAECRIDGVATNVPFLQALLQLEAVQAGQLHTRLIEQQLSALIKQQPQKALFVEGKTAVSAPTHQQTPAGLTAVYAPMPGSIVHLDGVAGETVVQGQTLAVIEAMKMEAVLSAPQAGVIERVLAQVGDILSADQPLFFMAVSDQEETAVVESEIINLDAIRPDLQELFDRRAFLLDENRPEAVAKRHGRGQRTARENVADLCDDGTFLEIGSVVVAAQRSRRPLDELIKRTPADGLICGYGAVNGAHFSAEAAQCLVMAYDYSVLAGTQGVLNHKKMDRMLTLAGEGKRPLIIFAEGGGGRPGDVDYMGVAQLDVMTFTNYASLSGKIPLISIVSGYCFAGNAALAGCADVIIATENCSIGMGGPAMIEGGGLGQFHPKEVGPASFQSTNGVIDVLVKDEAEAVAVAKKYVSYFQGTRSDWTCADQRLLRRLIPENRRRMYDVRQVIETVADVDSVLELRPFFGTGIITALIRIEGQPLGLIANNPSHLGGAIDSDGADKMARFMQLCEAFGLPIVSLVDTPGIMVGPEAEQTGTVRHAARLFITGASLTVPFFAIVLRKGYGLGAQAMCAGSFHVPFFTLAWPTGEFGAMGLEGAVRLGFRKELEAERDEAARQALFEKMVAHVYKEGKAINTASFMELDEVIDPLETRQRIVAGLRTAKRGGGKRPFIDSW